jgi:uncharacterized protein (DUF983 family)
MTTNAGTCPRCRRGRAHPGYVLEEPVCSACFDRAARTYGICPGCGVDQMLPGLADGEPVCRSCASITREFDCQRCKAEGRLYYRKVCIRCRLDDVARDRLDDGTGQMLPALQPLVSVLAKGFKGTPQARLQWLHLHRTRAMLTALATGELERDQWLFSGRSLGRAMSYEGLARQLRTLGIPLRLARVAAIRELVLDVPAPVVALALGFHHTTTHRQNNHAGGTWNRYAATRSPSASELMHQDPIVKPNHQTGKLITVLEVEVHGRAESEAGPHPRAGS